MSRAEALAVGEGRWRRLLLHLAWLKPPIDRGAFWVVQAGVAAVALIHEVFLDTLHQVLPLGYPSSFTVSLMLVPVVYAALNFGIRGAAATALWATAVMLPDLIVQHFSNRPSAWIETSTLIMVNAVALIVGQRVDHERVARHRAEQALRESERAQERYRVLFEEQHAPVLVVDESGVVVDANAAADSLFGSPSGAHLRTLLPQDLPPDGSPVEGALPISDSSGETRWFLPSVRGLPFSTHGSSMQIVLADITAEILRQEEQRDYSGHLIRVQEEERRNLARDLHDDPLQTLMFLVRSLDDLTGNPALPPELSQELRRDSDLADQTSRALREVIRGLRPPVLDDLGLEPALRHLATEVAHRCDLPVEVVVHGAARRLRPESELALYRVAQEALSNTVRHSGASRGTIDVQFANTVTLTVADDGVGVSGPARPGNGRGGLGIVGMRERLAQVSGTLDVSTAPGGGTRVRATVPGTG